MLRRTIMEKLINQDIFNLFNSQNITIASIIFNMLTVFLLSLIILFVYKRSYQTTVYNHSFAISLPLVAMVTSIIILSVSSNIILSFGMVGALSIVRFRTALKNPFDTVFMFWSIGLGITSGAGLLFVALVSTVIIAITIYLLVSLEIIISSYFLIIRADNYDNEAMILNKVKGIYGSYHLRNKTVKETQLDLTLEVRSKEDKYLLVNKINEISGVKSVILLSHKGDYISE